MAKGFWSFAEIKPFKEDLKLSFGALTIAYAIMAIVLFLYVNIPEAKEASSVFIFMALASGFTIAFSELASAGKIKIGFDFQFIGKKKNARNALIIGLLLGAGLIFLNTASGSVANTLFPQNISSTIDFVVVGIAAPIFEELFFRQTMLFIFPFLLGLFLGIPKGLGNIVGIIGSSLAWATYHISVLGGNPNNLVFLFIIGILYAVGNLYIFRSILFSTGAHLSNNILVLLRSAV